MITGYRLTMLAGFVALMTATTAKAQTRLQPYVMAYAAGPDLGAETDKVKTKLKQAGFQVLGEYRPYSGARVICITNPTMTQTATKTPLGGFGAVEHVALTRVGGQTQVSYLNPEYMAAAYQLADDYHGVAAALTNALGAQKYFGTQSGRSVEELRDYHYMFGMEYFKDVYQLGTYRSYQDAVEAVEGNLKKRVGGASLVYRLDIPGAERTVFGISRAVVTDPRANDQHIMADTVDPNFRDKTTAYLPYEMMVDGKNVIALHMRFRMAVWHPDLTMMTFGKLISSPGAIEDLLKKIAGGYTARGSDF